MRGRLTRVVLVAMAICCLGLAARRQVTGPHAFAPRVVSVTLSSGRARPGDRIAATYEFQNTGGAPATGELTVFVHAVPVSPGPGARQFGADFVPALPAFAWPAGSGVLEAGHAIDIPRDVAPGPYDVYLGMYDRSTGARVQMANEMDAERRVLLGRLVVDADVRPGERGAVTWRVAPSKAGVSAWAALAARRGGRGVRITSGRAGAECAADAPRVESYRLGTAELRNMGPSLPARARIRHGADGRVETIVVPDGRWKVAATATTARYSTELASGGRPAGAFTVTIRAARDAVTVTVEDGAERPGFELLDVTLPPLLGVTGRRAYVVVPTQSGRLVPLATAGPGDVTIGMDWFNTAVCGAAGDGAVAAAIDTQDWDNTLRAVVAGETQHRVGYFEPRIALRAEASSRAARIRLAARSAFRVRLAESGAQASPATWMDAAKVLRRDIHGKPNPLYRDALIYKVFCDVPRATDYTTFDQAVEIIRTAHRLAPWLKQIVYLVGWQYEGHDTGYPATDRVNARLGGLDGLRRAVAEAAKLNASLSVHDNFDDAYRDSPAFDESVVARDADGQLQKGGVWAGGQSYILAPAKYARKSGLTRVRRTVAMLGVRGSYHIDVLSAVPMRRDYNPAAPESTREAIAGKLAIVREFNRLGLDVTSEGFTAPFIGAIGHSWHLWHKRDTLFPGEVCVPFIPFIYHGGPTTWGNGAQTDHYARDSALWGAAFSTDWTKHVDPHEVARAIYLVQVPWALLRERPMQSWTRRGSVCRVAYGPGTYVEGDEASDAWRVVVDGVKIVDNDLVTLPRPNALVVLSPRARTADVALPARLARAPVSVRNLLTGAVVLSDVRPAGGRLTLDLPGSEPLWIGKALP